MAKFVFRSGEDRKFYVGWQGLAHSDNNPVVVLEGESVLGNATTTELKQGKEFKLADGGVLKVQLVRKFLIVEMIEVYLNGQKLKGNEVVITNGVEVE
jgi:hypothetical protein